MIDIKGQKQKDKKPSNAPLKISFITSYGVQV
jgi:hypothetical protein